MVQVVFQLSFSDQLVQIIPLVPAIFRGMSMILVILAIQVLVLLYGLPRHFVRPSEVWFILEFLQYLVHWFSEYSPDVPRAGRL